MNCSLVICMDIGRAQAFSMNIRSILISRVKLLKYLKLLKKASLFLPSFRGGDVKD